jgi:O-antigen/teichoic acid export membrane protein
MNVVALRTLLVTKLHNRRFLRNSGTLMLANIIVTGLALIRTPAMAWLLPKEDVGMIAVVGAWMPFILLLSLPGLDLAAYHYIAKGDQWALITNLKHRLRWALLGSLGFVAGAGYWWMQGNQPLMWIFVVAAFFAPLSMGLGICGGALGALERFGSLFWYRLGDSLTDFVGFIPLAFSLWWLRPGIVFYATNQLATVLMLLGIAWWLVRQITANQQRTPNPQEEHEMVHYGQHLTVLSGLSIAQSQIDSVLVSALFPLSVMADYAIAQIVYNQFKQLWSIYLAVRYPPFVRLPVQQRRRRIFSEGCIVFLGFGVIGMGVWVLAQWLIPVLLPPSYISSLNYIGWLIVSFLALLPGSFVEVYFRTEQDQKSQYVLRLISAVFSVALPATLIMRWGIQGVITGRILGYALFSLLGIVLFIRSGKRLLPTT